MFCNENGVATLCWDPDVQTTSCPGGLAMQGKRLMQNLEAWFPSLELTGTATESLLTTRIISPQHSLFINEMARW